MKRLLIIGAGFLQSFVIKRAKEMGYYTITIDKNPNSVGFEYADEYAVIDIVDQKACLKYALSKNIEGVITAATDYGVLSTAYIAKKMSLPGLNYEVAQMIKDKFKVRRTLFENNVDDISQYYEVSNIIEVNKISEKVNFPVMVKPCDGSGSQATNRVDSIPELKRACEAAIKSSLIGKALIEDFIEGTEYGVESFVYNGNINVLGVMKKDMTTPPVYAELGHSITTKLPNEDKIKNVVELAIKNLGINFGAVNMDVLITKDNHVCIVDVGARMGGNLIGSHIIPLSQGIDYMGFLIQASFGKAFEMKAENKGKNIVTRLLALRPGVVKVLPDFQGIMDNCNVRIYHSLKIGKKIKRYHNNLDSCGYVVSISDDTNVALKQAEKAKMLIDEGIVRE